MNLVKKFVEAHKSKIVIGSVVVGGVLIYILTRKRSNNGRTQIWVKTPNFKTLEEAVEQFKEFQETNKTVAMFWENDIYSVLDLEAK